MLFRSQIQFDQKFKNPKNTIKITLPVDDAYSSKKQPSLSQDDSYYDYPPLHVEPWLFNHLNGHNNNNDNIDMEERKNKQQKQQLVRQRIQHTTYTFSIQHSNPLDVLYSWEVPLEQTFAVLDDTNNNNNNLDHQDHKNRTNEEKNQPWIIPKMIPYPISLIEQINQIYFSYSQKKEQQQ